MKTLVAYYSKTGNTKFVAEKIAKQLNADLSEIIDKKKREGKLGFLKSGYAGLRQKLTEIEVSKPIDDYDVIVVGSPVWAGKITPAIRKFLVSNNFSNKLVAYFVTLDGNKAEKTLQNMKKTIRAKQLVGKLAITQAQENKEKTEEQVTDWCNQIQKSIN